MMGMGKKQNTWLWMMMPEDSSTGELNRSFTFNVQKEKRSIRSISKVLFWYGAALSLTLLLGKLH